MRKFAQSGHPVLNSRKKMSRQKKCSQFATKMSRKKKCSSDAVPTKCGKIGVFIRRRRCLPSQLRDFPPMGTFTFSPAMKYLSLPFPAPVLSRKVAATGGTPRQTPIKGCYGHGTKKEQVL
jgi:hypothetical protein